MVLVESRVNARQLCYRQFIAEVLFLSLKYFKLGNDADKIILSSLNDFIQFTKQFLERRKA